MEAKLTFSEFISYIESHLLEGWHEDYDLKVQKIRKNNGKEYTGFVLSDEELGISPVIYMEEMYERYQEGADIEEIMSWLRECYDYAQKKSESIDMDIDFTDFQKIHRRIIFRIVNYEKNKDILRECPHFRIHDLVVVFRCLVSWDLTGISSVKVTNEMLKMWDVDICELLVHAQKNTSVIFSPRIMRMDQFLEDGDSLQDEYYNPFGMYVATNETMINGASVILYEGFLESFAEEIDDNFYILPSSIHEMIFVPENNGLDVKDLSDMVREANESVVDQEDVLSDSVYYYMKEEGKLMCCNPS